MTAAKQLWPHQERAIALLRSSLATGHRRPMLQLPTGGGKTVVAASIFRMARDKNPEVKLLFVVDAISLIDQTVRAFYDAGLHGIGVIQADHPMEDWAKPLQVASVQTLQRRRMFDADIVIVDEAHRRNDWLLKTMAKEEYRDIPFIGLSATPWSRGLGHHYDDLLIPATMRELIDAKVLAPFRVFASAHPDLDGVKTQSGDYQTGQLSGAMQKSGLIADIVENWKLHGENRKTIAFCVDRAHAKKVQARFEAAGISCGYIDAFTERTERDKIKSRLEDGELHVVANVACLCLDEETEILTRQGWRGIDTIKDTDLVAAWSEDGIEFTKPKAIVKRQREPHEKMVVYGSNRANNVRVTGNHRMAHYSRRQPDRLKVASAESLVGKRVYFPVSGQAAPDIFPAPPRPSDNTMRIRANGLAYKYRKLGMAPEAARKLAEEFGQHKLSAAAMKMPQHLTLDECRFIGFWLGDGTKSGGRYSACQSLRYPKIIEWFDGVLDRAGVHHTREVRPVECGNNYGHVRWHFSSGLGGLGQQVRGGLAPLFSYLDKNGSDYLWGLSQEQLEALLHGLWMADGNHGDGETPSGRGRNIAIYNPKLRDLLQAICACRGYRTSVSGSKFSFKKQTKTIVATAPLVVEDEPFKDERVWCVTSSTSFLVVRRKGKVQIVGNTTGVDWPFVSCLILARPTKSPILACQIFGRGLRVHPGKQDCLVFDHADNTLRLGFPTDMGGGLCMLREGERSPKREDEPRPKECPSCAFVKPPGVHECPACGFKPERVSKIVERNGKLVELTMEDMKKKWEEYQRWYSMLLHVAKARGYSEGWAAHTFKKKFGRWPTSLDKTLKSPDPTVISYVQSRLIAHAKRRVAA